MLVIGRRPEARQGRRPCHVSILNVSDRSPCERSQRSDPGADVGVRAQHNSAGLMSDSCALEARQQL